MGGPFFGLTFLGFGLVLKNVESKVLVEAWPPFSDCDCLCFLGFFPFNADWEDAPAFFDLLHFWIGVFPVPIEPYAFRGLVHHGLVPNSGITCV